MDIVKEARYYAILKHKDQKYDNKPYLVHLEGVAELVEEHSEGCPVCQAVAYLHDIVEDTDVTTRQLCDLFGFVIGNSVYDLTDKEGKNRVERQLNTYHRIKGNRIAMIVKLCDRLFNMRQSAGKPLGNMYLKEYLRFKFALYNDDMSFEKLWGELDKAYEDLKL